MRNNGSAYPECNEMGEWKSVKYTKQMMNERANEIRKLQRKSEKLLEKPSKSKKMRKL